MSYLHGIIYRWSDRFLVHEQRLSPCLSSLMFARMVVAPHRMSLLSDHRVVRRSTKGSFPKHRHWWVVVSTTIGRRRASNTRPRTGHIYRNFLLLYSRRIGAPPWVWNHLPNCHRIDRPSATTTAATTGIAEQHRQGAW